MKTDIYKSYTLIIYITSLLQLFKAQTLQLIKCGHILLR